MVTKTIDDYRRLYTWKKQDLRNLIKLFANILYYLKIKIIP